MTVVRIRAHSETCVFSCALQVFQKDRVRRALQAIHAGCVLPFDGGRMGAINGMRPDGRKDTSSPQSEEFWTGVTYSLGSLMLMEVCLLN